MTMLATTLKTTVIVLVAVAALAGCSASPESIPNPGSMVCASAEELFSEPTITTVSDDELSSRTGLENQPRLSDEAESQLREAVPTDLARDIDLILGETTVDTADATERLQEWAIRACGIEVAFANDDTTAVEQAAGNDIHISGEQGTTISITGDADYALAACEAEVKRDGRGGTREVVVLDQFGTAVASWSGQGPCTLIDNRP